jgi:hypothetical protein
MLITRPLLAYIWPAALCAVLILLNGCVPGVPAWVGVVPVPTGNGALPGTRITHAQTTFIKPGKTTREEVIAHLGAHYVFQQGETAIAYGWDGSGVRMVSWCGWASNGSAGYASDEKEWYNWHAFLVAFDNQGVVRACAFKRPSGRHALNEHLDRWAAKLPPQAPGSP